MKTKPPKYKKKVSTLRMTHKQRKKHHHSLANIKVEDCV